MVWSARYLHRIRNCIVGGGGGVWWTRPLYLLTNCREMCTVTRTLCVQYLGGLAKKCNADTTCQKLYVEWTICKKNILSYGLKPKLKPPPKHVSIGNPEFYATYRVIFCEIRDVKSISLFGGLIKKKGSSSFSNTFLKSTYSKRTRSSYFSKTFFYQVKKHI